MASIRSGCTATFSTLYVPGAHGVDMRLVRVTVDWLRAMRAAMRCGLRFSSVKTKFVSGCEYDWKSVLRRCTASTVSAETAVGAEVPVIVVLAQLHLAKRLPQVCTWVGVLPGLEPLLLLV